MLQSSKGKLGAAEFRPGEMAFSSVCSSLCVTGEDFAYHQYESDFVWKGAGLKAHGMDTCWQLKEGEKELSA